MSSKSRLWLVYLSGFLMATHYASVAYINSSLLQRFVNGSITNILYMAGSMLSVTALFLAPFLLQKYGNIRTFLLFISLGILAVFGMAISGAATLVIILFIIHIAVGPILYLCLDLNLEQETKIEGTTGRKRGFLLTISNLAWVLSPLAIAFLVVENSFNKVYLLSGTALVLLFIIVSIFFKNTKQARTTNSNMQSSLKSLLSGGDKTRSIGIQFMLNFFFSWMVIYLPLLLIKEIGFDWNKTGLIFTVMLLPFLLFELPAGMLGDKKIGEKELIISGFIIMFLSTLVIPILSAPIFITWAAVLFVSRIGASIVEISNESYFFKHVKEEDTGLISIFRMVRPLSFVIAPLFAIPVIYFFSYSVSFYFLAFFVLFGLLFIPKVDTR